MPRRSHAHAGVDAAISTEELKVEGRRGWGRGGVSERRGPQAGREKRRGG